MRRFLVFLAVAGLLNLLPLLALAQEITLLNLQALQAMLSASKGKVVLLDFWASY